jgi:hypothetical protein
MDKNRLDKRLENLINKLDSSKHKKIPKAIPSWIKKSVLGAGIILTPFSFTGLSGCDQPDITGKNETSEIPDNCCTYDAPPPCYDYFHLAFVNITLKGSLVHAGIYGGLHSYGIDINYISTGRYELMICDRNYDSVINSGIEIIAFYESYTKTVHIETLPSTFTIELSIK